MGTIESLNSLAMIFIMVIPGIILSKKKYVSIEGSDGVAFIVTNVTWPCLVIDAMQIPYDRGILEDAGYAFLIMCVAFLAALLLAVFCVKVLKMNKRQGYIFTFMALFANTGFMGIPIINALYGKEAVFYASIVEMVNDVFLFTVGILLIQLSAGRKASMNLKGFLTPGMIGVIIGFVLFLLDYTLPGFLGGSISLIGGATTPLSMIVIGMQIGRMHIKELFGAGSIYILSLVKLIIIPAIVLAIMVLFLGDTSLLAKVIILDFAMPAAACSAIFSQQYKGEIEFATKGVLITTLLSMITLPVFTILLSIL